MCESAFNGLSTSAAVHQPTHRTQTAWVLTPAAVSTVHCSWTDCWHLKHCSTRLTVLLTEQSSLPLNWLLTLETPQHTAQSVADRTQFTAAELTAVTRSTAARSSQCCWQNTVHCSWTDCCHLQLTVLLTEHSSLQLNWLLSLKALMHRAHSGVARTQFTAAEVTAVTRSTAAYRSQCCWQNTVHCSWTDCCHLKHRCIQLSVADRTQFTTAGLTAVT